MNRIVTAIAILLVCGCAFTQTDARLTTPEEVCTSFVTEVSALASDHVELADFPGYAKNLESVSRVSFTRHLRPVNRPRIKEGFIPSDFEEHGIFLYFDLDTQLTERKNQAIWFPNLKLRLFSHLVLWEGASPELKRKLTEIMEKHKALLSELDKKAANKELKATDKSAP